MKLASILLVGSLGVAGCTPTTPPTSAAPAAPTVQTATRDGRSFASAIVIPETNTRSGIAAEYAWIKQNRPGWTVTTQVLADHNGKAHDILTIRKGSQTEEVYFDISNFFGRI